MKRRGSAYSRCKHKRAVHPKQKLHEYIAQRIARKIRLRAKKYDLRGKILELQKLMVGADIKFKKKNLRLIGVKGWSGYYGYLKQTAMKEVQNES